MTELQWCGGDGGGLCAQHRCGPDSTVSQRNNTQLTYTSICLCGYLCLRHEYKYLCKQILKSSVCFN
jgi:hypothetical protein